MASTVTDSAWHARALIDVSKEWRTDAPPEFLTDLAAACEKAGLSPDAPDEESLSR
jgi:hypothetical protein